MANQNPFPAPDKHKGRETPLKLLYHKTAEVERVTIEEASQIYYINLEIKTLQLELARLEESRTYYKPITISDMPKGGEHVDLTDEYLVRRQEIQDMLNYSLRKLQYERKRFETFLESVEDSETRLIMRLRCVNNMSWEEIGAEIGMDRRTASRKFYKYFDAKVAHNARR